MPGNCAFYAFDRWHESGGYLVLRCSARNSVVPHVLHQARDGVVTHYAPIDAALPPHRKLSFRGRVCVGDERADAAEPIPVGHLVAGAWLGAVLVTAWAITRLARPSRAES